MIMMIVSMEEMILHLRFEGGPYAVLTWGNGGWIDEFPNNIHMQWVGAHETGHIFQAFNKYSSTDASYTGNDCTNQYNGYRNENSEECSDGGFVSSIMRQDQNSEPPLTLNTNIDYWAQGMIGWNPTIPIVLNYTYDEIDKTIKVQFSEEIDLLYASNSIIVQGSKSGLMNCYYYGTDNNVIIIDPENDFQPQETVNVNLTSDLRAKSGINIDGNDDGTPQGPGYNFNVTTGGFIHSYSVSSIELSNTSPVVDEVVSFVPRLKM